MNLNLIYETVWTGAGSDMFILMLENLHWFLLTSLITLEMDVEMDGSVLEKKSLKEVALSLYTM